MDLDALAVTLYRDAGEDPEKPIAPHRLARAIWKHAHAVEVVAPAALRSKDAALVRIKNKWRIIVRRGLLLDQAGFLVARELARWALKQNDLANLADDDAAVDYLAAALLAPTQARTAKPGVAKARSTRRITAASDLDAYVSVGRLAAL